MRYCCATLWLQAEKKRTGTALHYYLEKRRILKDGVAFQDLGADYYNQFNKERKINVYLKKLKALGWEMPLRYNNDKRKKP